MAGAFPGPAGGDRGGSRPADRGAAVDGGRASGSGCWRSGTRRRTAYPREHERGGAGRGAGAARPGGGGGAGSGRDADLRRARSRRPTSWRRRCAPAVWRRAPASRCACDRSTTCIRALLAVWKAGAVYVPLDPGYPPARLGFMLQDADAAVVLTTDGAAQPAAGGRRAGDVRRHGPGGGARRRSIRRCRRPPAPSLAYVMYTSGSTGQPKGVAVPHRAIARLVQATNYITLTAADRVAHAASVAFDAATFEIWGALANGAQVVIVPTPVAARSARAGGVPAAGAGHGVVRDDRSVPSAGRRAARRVCVARHAVVWRRGDRSDAGADGAAAGRPAAAGARLWADRERRRLRPGTWSTAVSAAAVTVPIGRPISNTQAYVLDRARGAGADWRAGRAVPGRRRAGATAMLAHPALTAERFVPDPVQRGARGAAVSHRRPRAAPRRRRARVSRPRRRPGEAARASASNRAKSKRCCARHPLVREAVVLAREYAPATSASSPTSCRRTPLLRPTRQRRHAAPGQRPISQEQVASLRDFLAGHLPEYMLPAAFALMDAFPLVNGKIERSALPLPDAAGSGCAGHRLHAGHGLEKVMCAIWKELLYVDEIDAGRDFFELGGHSLLVMQLVSRVRDALQVELPVRKVFESPTLPALCRALARARIGRGSPREDRRTVAAGGRDSRKAAVDMLGTMNQPRRAS